MILRRVTKHVKDQNWFAIDRASVTYIRPVAVAHVSLTRVMRIGD